MTHFEFWTNLATVILLVPAIILSFRLSRQLGKLNQNQERMIESMISRKRDCKIARLQDFKKEWKLESKIEIKQSFKIAIWKQRKLYGWIDWKQ